MIQRSSMLAAFAVLAINKGTGTPAVEAINESASGDAYGIYGASDAPTGIGILGQATVPSVTFGNSTGGLPVGVIGDTGATGGAGLLATADSGYAVYGLNNGSYVTGLFLNKSTTLSYALEAGTLFQNCTVNTAGDLQCTGTQAAVMPLPDQRAVQLYAVQSPENWFEDFGSGQLSGGSAVITLEPTFAQTVNTGAEYHVFLTPNGDSRGLFVTAKSATSFEVREQGGGASSVTFDYRIVAKRKGYEGVRMADVTESRNRLLADGKRATERTGGQARSAGPRTLRPNVTAKQH